MNSVGLTNDDTPARTRPTLRCLDQDLCLKLPPITEPLDEIDHPLLAKAIAHFADPEVPGHRIVSIDDNVLFKVKIQRWRGAVYTDETAPWLVAAGHREDGSPDDFYTQLADPTSS